MLNDILTTLLQSVISIVVLFILARFMGKRQLSQLTFFDYVVGISIGSIAASFAVDSSINYAKGITGLVVFAIFPIALSLISLKSCRARRLLDGKPTILVSNGQIVEKNLRKSHLTVDNVLAECRFKNAFNIADVEFAILETDGKVSVELKSQNQPLTPKDMNIASAYKGLCINVIIDGEILDEHLLITGKDRRWLEGELKNQNVQDYKQVLLGYIDSSNNLIVQRRNAFEPPNPLI